MALSADGISALIHCAAAAVFVMVAHQHFGQQPQGKKLHAGDDKYGSEKFDSTCDYLVDYAERVTRAAIRQIPSGEYREEMLFEDENGGRRGR